MLIVNCKSTPVFIERDDLVRRYFTDIRRIKVLPDEEQRKHLRIVKYGNEEEALRSRNILMETNQRFVASVAKHLANGDNFIDLVSEGNIGLSKAIDKFDLEFKQHFITYATFWINKAMIDYMVNVERIVVPKNANKVWVYAAAAANDFFLEKCRYPSADELQSLLHEQGVDIFNSDDLRPPTMLSINEIDPDTTTDEDFKSVVAAEEFQRVTASNNIQEEIDMGHIKETADKMLSQLTPRQREVMEMYYGIGCNDEPISAIARKLNIEPKRVSREMEAALKKLRKRYRFQTNKSKNGKTED